MTRAPSWTWFVALSGACLVTTVGLANIGSSAASGATQPQHEVSHAGAAPPAPVVPSVEHAALLATLDRYLGVEPGTLGPVFDGFRFGMPFAQIPPSARDALTILDGTSPLSTTFEGEQLVWQVAVRLDTMSEVAAMCEPLRRELIRRWGSGLVIVEDGRVRWYGDHRQQRMTLYPGDCSLEFEQYTHVTAWFEGPPTSSLPTHAIGRPAAELLATLGARARVAGSEITWQAPGPGSSFALFTAYVVRRKITSIEIFLHDGAGPLHRRTWEELTDELTRRHGHPSSRDHQVLTWDTTPPISLWFQVLIIGAHESTGA